MPSWLLSGPTGSSGWPLEMGPGVKSPSLPHTSVLCRGGPPVSSLPPEAAFSQERPGFTLGFSSQHHLANFPGSLEQLSTHREK